MIPVPRTLLFLLLLAVTLPAVAAGTSPPATPGELDEAIDRLSVELDRAGSDALRSRIEQGLADVLVLRARVADRQENDPLHAEQLYERALALRPGHVAARVELAWLEIREDRLDRALDLALTGLAGSPANPWLLEVVGEVQYRRNRLEDAVEALRAAVAARPGDASLRKRLAKVERDLAAESGYSRADSTHFVLRFDGDRDDRLGAALLDELERAYGELADELDAWTREPVTVILYTNRQFHDTTGTGERVAGLFDGKIRLPVGGLDRVTPAVRRVARHELVHALVHARAKGHAPRWLHEGLAQLLEPRDPATVDRALSLAVRRGRKVSIVPFSYPTALSFTAFLDRETGRHRLTWFLELLAAGRPEPQAFLEAFGWSMEEAERRWQEWLRDPG